LLHGVHGASAALLVVLGYVREAGMRAAGAAALLDGAPAHAVGATEPLPADGSAAAQRSSWGGSVREVGSDAELREALVQAGQQTVRRGTASCADDAPAQRAPARAGGRGLQRRVVREVQSGGARRREPGAAGMSCAPAAQVQPLADRLRPPAQHADLRFVVADADFLPEMASDIRYTPTFSFFQRGKKARAACWSPVRRAHALSSC
jgi:hypothetical protein